MRYAAAACAALAGRLSDTAIVQGAIRRSWGEVLERTASVAGGLARLGVRPGDRVAILSTNSDIYIELFLAIPWVGVAMVPLNTRWSSEEIVFAVSDSEPTAILLSDDFRSLTPALATAAPNARIVRLSGGDAGLDGDPTYGRLLDADPLPEQPGPDDELFGIFYTGGTTGRPKGVMLSHRGLLANAEALRATGLFPSGCSVLHVAPVFHLAAGVAVIATTLAGGTHLPLQAFDPVRVLEVLVAQQASDVLLVPTMIQMLLDHPSFTPASLSRLQRILYGASPINESTLARIQSAAPHVAFFQAYGMTEVSCAATVLRPEDHLAEARRRGKHRSAGTAIAGVKIQIVEPGGQPLARGEVGEIAVKGPGVMLGYWRQPQQTEQAVRDGWMHTGDGGWLDDEGYVHIVDRLKDMIVSGGENVYSAEVESVLATHPAVGQCAVIGVPDACWGERVHAVVVLKPQQVATSEELFEHCRSRIAGYKCPRSIDFRSTPMPLSAAGKILKNVLRESYWSERDRNVG